MAEHFGGQHGRYPHRGRPLNRWNGAGRGAAAATEVPAEALPEEQEEAVQLDPEADSEPAEEVAVVEETAAAAPAAAPEEDGEISGEKAQGDDASVKIAEDNS